MEFFRTWGGFAWYTSPQTEGWGRLLRVYLRIGSKRLLEVAIPYDQKRVMRALALVNAVALTAIIVQPGVVNGWLLFVVVATLNLFMWAVAW